MSAPAPAPDAGTAVPSGPDAVTPPPTGPRGPDSGGFRATLRSAHLVHRGAVRIAGVAVLLATVVTFGLYLWTRLAPDRERCDFRDGDMLVKDEDLSRLSECYDSAFGYQSALSWYRLLVTDLDLWVLVPVVLVAAFVAGPLIARELESGTFRLAWTQAETPRRWLTGRLVLGCAVVIVAGTVCVGLIRFARTTSVEQGMLWSHESVFPTLGPVLVAYLVLAVALGALVGLLLRRVILSMAAALLGTGAVLVGLAQLRPYLWPHETYVRKGEGEGTFPPGNSYQFDYGLLTLDGDRVPHTWLNCPGRESTECLRGQGYSGRWIDYHPASHFWPLQLVETGIVLALAALAVFVSLRVLRKIAP
ncbi:hypothetical protein ACFVW2_19900 [Streptomyces sp. NPDC058171]